MNGSAIWFKVLVETQLLSSRELCQTSSLTFMSIPFPNLLPVKVEEPGLGTNTDTTLTTRHTSHIDALRRRTRIFQSQIWLVTKLYSSFALDHSVLVQRVVVLRRDPTLDKRVKPNLFRFHQSIAKLAKP
jgi:hypothetical protein